MNKKISSTKVILCPSDGAVSFSKFAIIFIQRLIDLMLSLCLSGKFWLNDFELMALAFARQLREGTKKSHTMAENTGFISCFLKGVVDKSSYRNLLADLYFVYSAMEEEIEKLCENSLLFIRLLSLDTFPPSSSISIGYFLSFKHFLIFFVKFFNCLKDLIFLLKSIIPHGFSSWIKNVS